MLASGHVASFSVREGRPIVACPPSSWRLAMVRVQCSVPAAAAVCLALLALYTCRVRQKKRRARRSARRAGAQPPGGDRPTAAVSLQASPCIQIQCPEFGGSQSIVRTTQSQTGRPATATATILFSVPPTASHTDPGRRVRRAACLTLGVNSWRA